ncbi:histidine kinase [Actinoplanes sp. SE50]|uniref:sensor histidine kinase n=1 Tax=unclassified Actinoplanes TaxID=2626549 RepID=UPI00023ED54D|nr:MULTISPECIES: nitrate- and nitrite sensing domain-containing protein [unclassified Actinoplanes]AEV81725.1 histidine kinase [Actinoplanes sp. SE50/110]ATO80126.1 histidine kinase [Actinoplanes sp. SE50]SLL97530.1 histidine kinase [Actinoplanes sp. SE50/110]
MSTGSSGLPVRRGPLSWSRDAGIRTKLAGLMVIPLVAALALASVRLIDVRGTASDAGRVADLTRIGTDLSGLSRLLHQERMAAAAFLADTGAAPDRFRTATEAVDTQIRTFRAHRTALGDVPARVADRLRLIQEQLGTLTDIRGAVEARKDLPIVTMAQRYDQALDQIFDFDDVVVQIAEPGTVADGLRGLAAFGRIQEAVADQEATGYVVQATRQLGAAQQQELIGAQVARQAALDDFRQIADRDQIGLVESTLSNPVVAQADGLVTRLAGGGSVDADELTTTYGQVLDLLQDTGGRLDGQVAEDARYDRDAAARRATVEFIVVLLVLTAAIAIAAFLARRLHLSLRMLREGALAVAHRDLPDAVTRLQDADSLGEGGVDRIVAETRDPFRLTDRDEFGQVAEAFNMVHREAIRVAAEQAALRTSVSAMFLSLARRSQALVDRMIGELDQIERTEEDPKRLAKLFDLDHLATRMRRNDENLLVLAGADVGAPRREDALLVDVLRAAQSEVEQYHRIEFGAIDTDVAVAAAAVNDVVRLIAELLDNATRFSPPTTVVMAHGRRSGEQLVVQVEDRGLGITPEQLEVINRRLAEPAEVDVAAFRLMGFAVIARLAARHGITVRLLPHREGGTIAEISLPAEVTVLPGMQSTPGRAASWTRPGPPPQAIAGAERATPEVRPPVRTVPAPTAPAAPRWAAIEPGPQPDLDLRPTPDRPPLPTRVPKPDVGAEPAPTPLFTPAAAPVSAHPVSAHPVSVHPVSAPIQVRMQHSWFEGEAAAGPRGMPTAGYAPAPVSAMPATAPVSAAPVSVPAASAASVSVPAASAASVSVPAASAAPVSGGGAVPRPRPALEDRWRTAADDGWQRARDAAAPRDAGTTRSGLPKRIPQAQLVPGGVTDPPRAQHRRSPDDVRGLLSAYTRGVQRGRTDGTAEAPPAPKENRQ